MAKFNELIKGDQPVLIDFSAEWCGPCKMMGPILKELKGMVGDRIRILKIDVDRNPVISQKFEIRGVPTLMLFKNGNVLWRQSGVIPAAQLKEILSRYI